MIAGRPPLREVRQQGRHHRHREDGVGQQEEQVRGLVRGDVAGPAVGQHEHDPQRDLVGDDVAEGPARQSQHRAYRVVARVPHEAQTGPRLPEERDQRGGLDGHARGRPQAEERQRGGVVTGPGQRGRPQHVGHGKEHGDDDQVVEDRSGRGSDEPPSRVEHRAGQRDEPVEEDLRCEHAQEGRGHRLLVAARLAAEAEGVQPDDDGRGEEEEHRDNRQQDRCDRHHRRHRAPRVVLVARRQAVDEDGHEGGREDPAQDEFVDDVRRRVGQVVAVGQAHEAERVGEGEDASEAGEPRQHGAGGHAHGGPAEGGVRCWPDLAWLGHCGTSRRARRPRRR